MSKKKIIIILIVVVIVLAIAGLAIYFYQKNKIKKLQNAKDNFTAPDNIDNYNNDTSTPKYMKILKDKKYNSTNTNNPFNIRANAANQWKGQIGIAELFRGTTSIGYFCVFDTINNGFRAGTKLLANYINKFGKKTVNDIINMYAPPSDGNDTESYINKVTNYIKQNSPNKAFDRNTQIAVGSNEFKLLCECVLNTEQGSNNYLVLYRSSYNSNNGFA